MTDAKQALEVVEKLRQYPDLPRIPVAGQALMSEAASLLSSLAEENERLRGAMRPFLTLARAVTVDGSPDFVHWAREAKDWTVAFSFAGHSISLGDLRALAALSHPKGADDGC